MTAGVVGLALGLGVWVALRLAERGTCLRQPDWGCLGLFVYGFPALVGGATLVGWVALRAARVWLAGPVVTVGLVVAWILLGFGADLGIGGTAGVIVVGPVAYVLAAVLTGPSVPAWWVRAAIVAIVAASLPVGPWLRHVRQEHQLQDQLAGYGHPLYAADLPGYQVRHPFAADAPPRFGYTLVNQDQRAVSVEQRPLAPGTPVPPCWSGSDNVPCPEVAPGVLRVGTGMFEAYEVRLDGQMISVVGQGQVTPQDVYTAATHLRERPPGYFTTTATSST
ncbi:hypothetical protein GCM10029964_011310 [Kibdelosporangium lantanae]